MTAATGAARESRLARRIRRDFPSRSTDAVLARLQDMAASSSDLQLGSERVQAGVLLAARGDEELLGEAISLALADWRDVLVAGGLADVNWQDRLDDEFGAEETHGR